MNNAFWFCHRIHASAARLVHAAAYTVPTSIGPVDVATFGCVLLHLRDPFAALARVAPLTREAIIITEPMAGLARHVLPPAVAGVTFRALNRAAPRSWRPSLRFLPDGAAHAPMETWWGLGPTVLCRMLEVLGFGDTTVTWHRQRVGARRWLMVTVVGRKPP